MNINEIKLPDNIEKNKKIIPIIVAAVIIFSIILFYVLNGDNKDKNNNGASGSAGKSLPNIEQEKQLMKSYKFNRLNSFIKNQITVGDSDTGRQNPFINYK